MGNDLQCNLFIFLQLLLPVFSWLVASQSLGSPQPRCHADEAAALLEFKDKVSCPEDSDPGKLGSWSLEAGDCCTWDGIDCDHQNGHVIGIDISRSTPAICSNGGIDSNSSLFHLVHLQKLNLSSNNFYYSSLPPAISSFSKLTSLDLSGCGFTGQVPPEFLGLTSLSLLDLSLNDLKLSKPNLEDLFRSFNKLEELDLSLMNLSCPLPDAVGNLSSLKSFVAQSCQLQGELPAIIFDLPKLQVLDVSGNSELSGHLPEFSQRSSLEYLSLYSTKISGELPNSLGNLASLTTLELGGCDFTGVIPSSLSSLTRLVSLGLSSNKLQGPIQPIGNLTQLRELRLSHNQFAGSIPSSFGHLVDLEYLDLGFNQLTGQIPSQLMNLTKLATLDLSFNRLNGTVLLDMLMELKNLSSLSLSFNELSVNSKPNATANDNSPLFQLGLASCNITEIPKVTQNLGMLLMLDLSENEIRGPVPMWFLDSSLEKLQYLNLSFNFLTGFTQNPAIFKWPIIDTIDLRFNEIEGSFPIPPESILFYHISNNKLSGEISPRICSCSKLEVLDLSSNNFTGVIPQCLSNLSETLTTLTLHGNNFFGRVPLLFEKTCKLGMIDLSNNHLEGPVPRSLLRCTSLEFLNLGNNMLRDTFPWWLGSLASLRVLMLRSNRFHGVIMEPKKGFEFPALQIIDLSQNSFSGHLPSKYFQSWSSMSISSSDQAQNFGQGYMSVREIGGYSVTFFFYFTMTLMNKGIEMEYPKILGYFKGVDLSSNNFIGEIPNSIAGLKELHLLNLSNNNLMGAIPPPLGAIVSLEALDLSRNNLSGEIPQQLTELNFLSFFNVSYNKLFGPIPRGQQFDTFGSNSYQGNEGLCGDLLPRKCTASLEPPPPAPLLQNDPKIEESDTPVIEWKAVAVGYASGFIIAAISGHWIITARHYWFVRTFGLGQTRRRRRRR